MFIIRGDAKGGEDYFRIEFHQILSFRKDAIHSNNTFHAIVFGLFDADFPAISSPDSEPRPSETIVQGLTSIPVPHFAAGTPWDGTPQGPMVASHTEQGRDEHG